MSLINDALKRARQMQKRPAISPSGEGITSPPLQPMEELGREKSQRLLVVIPVLLLSLGASFWFLWKWKSAEAKAAASSGGSDSAEVQTTRTAKTNALAIAAETMTQWKARQESVEMESPAEVKASTQAETKKTAVLLAEATRANESAKTTNTSPPGLIITSSGAAVAGGPSLSAQTRGTLPVPPNTTPANRVSSGAASSVSPATVPTSETVAINSSPQAAPPVPITEPVTVPKLQGIFYRLKRPTAVIDGRIVSLGDDINGHRVIRIERDTVKLVAGGRTNTLTLH